MMDPRRLLTLEDFSRGGGSPTEQLVQRNWPYWIEPPRRPEGIAPRVRAYVEVNHGRWIINCPFEGCEGAQLASRAEHRFFCIDCLHRPDPEALYRWVVVVWPTDEDARRIETALLKRPLANRNWLPSEPSNLLVAENAAFMGEEHLKDLVP